MIFNVLIKIDTYFPLICEKYQFRLLQNIKKVVSLQRFWRKAFQSELEKFGRLAQLVQSICLTSRGSGVRIPQRPPSNSFFKQFGRLAQLVQSICLTSRGSGVRIPQRPHKKKVSLEKVKPFFVFKYTYFVDYKTSSSNNFSTAKSRFCA